MNDEILKPEVYSVTRYKEVEAWREKRREQEAKANRKHPDDENAIAFWLSEWESEHPYPQPDCYSENQIILIREGEQKAYVKILEKECPPCYHTQTENERLKKARVELVNLISDTLASYKKWQNESKELDPEYFDSIQSAEDSAKIEILSELLEAIRKLDTPCECLNGVQDRKPGHKYEQHVCSCGKEYFTEVK